MKKHGIMLVISALLLFTVGYTVLAFSDTQSAKNGDKIDALKDDGIIAGIGNDKFNPKGKLTYAAGISMIVKGLDVSLARFSFIKEPLASDYYTYVKDGQWYSNAFVIANVNGLDVPKDVKPEQIMTREQFAHHLFRAVEANNQHAYPEIFIEIKDEAQISKPYKDSIQKLLISKIVSLDSDQQFQPQTEMIRGEAAGWVYEARAFVHNTAGEPQSEPQPSPLTDITLTSKAVSDKVTEVTVTAQAPHPGYGIRITSIQFNGKEAIIHTEPILPDPDKMYAQVITEVTAVTYVGAEYKPVLAESSSTAPSEPATDPETETVQ
ncbi:MAG TPA: S-layer homology domain-containing protein [Bacilli bacterium]